MGDFGNDKVFNVALEKGDFNHRHAEQMIQTLNAYYGNAGLRANLSDQDEILISIIPDKATSPTTRGRRAISTINVKCGDIRELIKQGKSDKEIMAHYNIPRATYYRKKKSMEVHDDMTRPF